MKIAIETTYQANMTESIDLPCPWEEIEYHYIKWHTFYYKQKGKSHQIDLDDQTLDAIDMKRPTEVTVMVVDDQGNPDYSNILGE